MWPNSSFGFWIFLSFRIFWISLASKCWSPVLFFLDNSDTSGPYLLLQVSLCLRPIEHLFAILENSKLRRDWNFDLRLHQVLPDNPIYRLGALSIPGLLDAIGLFTDEELVETKKRPGSSPLAWISPQSCFLLLVLASFSPPLIKLKILGTRPEMADVEQMKKIVPFIHHVWNFLWWSAIRCLVSMCLIWILGSKLILSSNQSRATLWVLDTCLILGLLPLITIFRLIVLTDIQHGIGQKNSHSKARCQHETNQDCRAWLEHWFDSWCACLTWCDATSLPVPMNPWFYQIGLGIMEHFKNPIPKIKSWNSINRLKRNYLSSVELWETGVCFLHIQLIGTNVLLPKMHRIPPDVDFESFGSPAKSESWNNLIYIVVLYFPHDNFVRLHLCDMLSSISWWHEQACFQTIEISGLPVRSKYMDLRTIVRTLLTILQQVLFLLLWIDGRQYMEFRLDVIVESFCSPIRNLFPRIPMRKCLPQFSLKK